MFIMAFGCCNEPNNNLRNYVLLKRSERDKVYVFIMYVFVLSLGAWQLILPCTPMFI